MTDETDPIGERIRAASQTVSAPLALRESIDRASARRPNRYPSRARLALVGGLLATVATIAAIFAPGSPTVEHVASRALAGSERAAPAGVDGYLPGFHAVGARTDTIAGHRAVTLIYRRGSVAVRYTVVDGRPLHLPGSRRVRAGMLDVAVEQDGDTAIVAWHARGKTCVLATRDAGPGVLLDALRAA